jgi:hypothetical protein
MVFGKMGARLGPGGLVKKRRIAVNFLIIAVCLFSPGVEKSWAAPEETVDKSPSPGGRNPFAYPAKILKEMALTKKPEGKPGAEAPTTAKMYTLSGILWTERGGVASINQRILREGETLDEYKVTRIEPGKVVLRKSDEEIILNLFQSPVVITRHEDNFQSKRKR